MVPKPVQPGTQNHHLKGQKPVSLIRRYNFAFKRTEPTEGPVQASCPSFPSVSDVVVGLSAQIRVGTYVYACASGFSPCLRTVRKVTRSRYMLCAA